MLYRVNYLKEQEQQPPVEQPANPSLWNRTSNYLSTVGDKAVGVATAGKEYAASKLNMLSPNTQTALKYGGGALVGAAGLYALYKMLKSKNNIDTEKLNQIRSIVNR